jgi:ABC-type transport system involved in cytochrome c biogenesis permease subunit
MIAVTSDISPPLAVSPRPPGWLLLHIPLVIVAYLLLLAAAAAGILFILQEGRIKRHSSVAVTSRLPSLDAMEQFIYRMIFASFPLLTLGILLGGHWALRTRGRFWGWDPTETFSFVTWMIYAVYLGLRWGCGWRGRRSTCLALAGFVIILVTLVALFFFSPLHTMGGPKA